MVKIFRFFLKNGITWTKLNEHEITAFSLSFHRACSFDFFLKSADIVVAKENMLFSLIGYWEHNKEAIKFYKQ